MKEEKETGGEKNEVSERRGTSLRRQGLNRRD